MRRPALWLALVCHTVLAGLYLVVTPVFEAPDEQGHFRYVRYLLTERSLPLIPKSAAKAGRDPGQEISMGHHPPLYYGILAATQELLGAPDVAATARTWKNLQGEVHPVFLWAHGYDELAPVSREVRVFRWLRIWSVLFGLGTVLVTHRLALLAFPKRAAVADGAALLLAVWPQWSFLSAVLDNGNLAVLLCHLVFLLLALGLARGRFGLGSGACLGAVVGLALLTKFTALFLLPLAGAAFAYGLLRWPERRTTILSGILVLAVAALLSGWFYLRNLGVYGELFALQAHAEAYAENRIPEGRLGWYLRNRFPREVYGSFVGSFGWGGVKAPPLLLDSLKLLALVALAGWLLRARRLVERPLVLLLLGLATVLVFAGLLRFNLVFRQPQGRYLFPAIGPMAILFAAGLIGAWDFVARGRGARLLALGLAALLPAGALALVLGRVRPNMRIEPEPAGPYFASLTLDAATPQSSEQERIRPTAPEDGARLQGPPRFSWISTEAQGSLYTLHVFTRSGRLVAASYEHAWLRNDGSPFDYPTAFWELLPPEVELLWRVRRLPNRAAGEEVADVPESAPRAFTRIP